MENGESKRRRENGVHRAQFYEQFEILPEPPVRLARQRQISRRAKDQWEVLPERRRLKEHTEVEIATLVDSWRSVSEFWNLKVRIGSLNAFRVSFSKFG